MAVFSIIPNENVNIQDIVDTLVHNGAVFTYEDIDNNGALTTLDLRQLFTKEANTKKWAKYKPVPYTKNFCQAFDSTKPDYDANWYKGNNGLCGLKITNGTGSTIYDRFKSSKWEYDPPKGGESEPFRLSDFCGYYPDAVPFISTGIKKGSVTQFDLWTLDTQSIGVSLVEDDKSLSMLDLGYNWGTATLYAHVGVVTKVGDTESFVQTLENVVPADKLLYEGGTSVAVNFSTAYSQYYLDWAMQSNNYLALIPSINGAAFPWDDDNYFVKLFKPTLKDYIAYQGYLYIKEVRDTNYKEIRLFNDGSSAPNIGYYTIAKSYPTPVMFQLPYRMVNSWSSSLDDNLAGSRHKFRIRVKVGGASSTTEVIEEGVVCNSSGTVISEQPMVNSGIVYFRCDTLMRNVYLKQCEYLGYDVVDGTVTGGDKTLTNQTIHMYLDVTHNGGGYWKQMAGRDVIVTFSNSNINDTN